MGKIKFYADASKVGMPFISVNEGGFQNAVFMIDTGSTENVLFGYVYVFQIATATEGGIGDGCCLKWNEERGYTSTFLVRLISNGGYHLWYFCKH